MEPYQQSIDEVIKSYKTDVIRGLSEVEVRNRQWMYGLNTLEEKKQDHILTIFLRQFKNPLIYILLTAATIIFFVGENILDAFIISGILFFNALIGAVQEGRAQSILRSLQRFIVSESIVIRDGDKKVIDSTQLVPGDVIFLQSGQRVPADARIIEMHMLHMDEALLTGESGAVKKDTISIDQENVISEQHNMVFKGTYVLSGSGKAIVTAIGKETEIGKIHLVIEDIKTDMPLKQELNRLSRWILLIILVMCCFLFLVGWLQGRPLQELLIMLTALFICVIPEGLPVVLTLVLIAGVYRMAKHKILVKNMQAVEGLGRADVIVIDKTGTITRNEMMVSRLFVVDDGLFLVTGQGYHIQGKILDHHNKEMQPDDQSQPLRMIGIACSLLNSAEIKYISEAGLFEVTGDPTEAALYILSQKLGYKRSTIEQEYKKIYEIPFDSSYRYHAGFYVYREQGIMFISGSPELLIDRARNDTNAIKQILTNLLEDGLRVVALGMQFFAISETVCQKAQEKVFKGIAEGPLVILGLCGIEDAIREEVPLLMQQLRDAGIRVIMATGDHHETALHIAQETGIFRENDQVFKGNLFDITSDKDLLAVLPRVTVFSRVLPLHKLRIIELLHKQGHIVAMTGDGINDAPSLIAADLGIAMGRIGTEVAKQASDIILLDDSFTYIVAAIEEGRHIFYTLRRVILYFFATNMSEILIVLFALILNIDVPLTAAQILWLNLVTDGFLDVALSTEPQESILLQQTQLGQEVHLMNYALFMKMLWMSIPMGVISLGVFMYYYSYDVIHARTMAVVVLAMFQWFNAWNCRSDTRSIFQLGLFSNRWLIYATIFIFFLQIMFVYAPFMHYIFKTVPISFKQWILVIALSSSIILFEEIRKWFVRWYYGLTLA